MKPTFIDFSEQKVSKPIIVPKQDFIEEPEKVEKCRYGSECSIVISDGLEFYEL